MLWISNHVQSSSAPSILKNFHPTTLWPKVSFLSWGTLKSTRMNTRWPDTSTESILDTRKTTTNFGSQQLPSITLELKMNIWNHQQKRAVCLAWVCSAPWVEQVTKMIEPENFEPGNKNPFRTSMTITFSLVVPHECFLSRTGGGATELFTAGWVDAHDISVRVHQHTKKPTCITANGGVSHNTKILCNPIVANSIIYCNAWDDFLFATHPTLVLACNLNTISRPHAVWKLPKPFSCHNFDREVADEFQPHPNFSAQFNEAITRCDVQQAADLWTAQAETVLAKSARDQEGKSVHFPQSHFGRNKGPKIINSPLSTPVIKPARQAEPNPNLAQGPTRYRQHLRQYRRLHTLVGLYRAKQKHPTPQNIKACEDLWMAIGEASGFQKHGFPKWVCDQFSILYSYHLPTIEVVIFIRDKFGEHFQTFTQKIRDDF